jgi:hypothetical protein
MSRKRKLKIQDLKFELGHHQDESGPVISIGREGESLKINPCLEQITELRDFLNTFIHESRLHKALQENDG